MKREIEIIKELYTSLNSNDLNEVFKFFDSQIERVEFEGTPSGGSYSGLEAVKKHFSQGRETWADGGCNPEKFIVAGDKVVVLVHVRVKLKKNNEWVEGHTADAFTFRNGKITEMRTFFNKEEAFAWAGVKPDSPHGV